MAEMAARGAQALGARYAILTTFAFGIWGALHYFIAARFIRADLARAEGEIPV